MRPPSLTTTPIDRSLGRLPRSRHRGATLATLLPVANPSVDEGQQIHAGTEQGKSVVDRVCFAPSWWIIAFDGATGERTLIGRLYRGYTISTMGSIIGPVWAFFDCWAGGAVLAWLDSLIAGRRGGRNE